MPIPILPQTKPTPPRSSPQSERSSSLDRQNSATRSDKRNSPYEQDDVRDRSFEKSLREERVRNQQAEEATAGEAHAEERARKTHHEKITQRGELCGGGLTPPEPLSPPATETSATETPATETPATDSSATDSSATETPAATEIATFNTATEESTSALLDSDNTLPPDVAIAAAAFDVSNETRPATEIKAAIADEPLISQTLPAADISTHSANSATNDSPATESETLIAQAIAAANQAKTEATDKAEASERELQLDEESTNATKSAELTTTSDQANDSQAETAFSENRQSDALKHQHSGHFDSSNRPAAIGQTNGQNSNAATGQLTMPDASLTSDTNTTETAASSSADLNLSLNATGVAEKFNPPIRSVAQSVIGQVTETIATDVVSFSHTINEAGSRQLTLEINPPELGRLEIMIDSTDDIMRAQIIASESVTSEMLTREKAHLIEALKEQGIDLPDVDISHHDPRDTDRQQSQSSDSNQRPPRIPFGRSRSNTETPTAAPLPTPTPNNRINLVA